MVCHGFGGGKVRSPGVSPADIKAIAADIRRLWAITVNNKLYKGVNSAHIVNDPKGRYDIIFQFGDPSPKMMPEAQHDKSDYHQALREAIIAIVHNGHRIHDKELDLWIEY